MIEKIKYIYRAYRYRYKIDRNEIQFILQHLKKGETAVDIGCNKGGYLYWMLKMVGQEGRIFAFEPQKKLYTYLQEIKRIFSYQNVTVEHKGISSNNGIVSFNIPITKKGTSPGARIGDLNPDITFKKLSIDVVTLDDYFLSQKIYPNLIKIDVEGHEKNVLLGGLQLLKKYKPILLIECENRHLNEGDISDVFQILIDLNYKGYFFWNGELKDISTFNVEEHQSVHEGEFWKEKGYVNNFIFR